MSQDIHRAVRDLRAGKLVAFPTETVYGLGADGDNADAVRAIFALKGRPATRPITLHVHPAADMNRWAHWDARSQALADAFWPGPLTLIRPKRPTVNEVVAAGGPSVGLRAPDHPLTLAFFDAFGGAVAAPSANRTGRPSPTSADDVRGEFGDQCPLVLDGGPCKVGLESTVLSLVDAPTILRQGQVRATDLEAILGEPVGFAGPQKAPHYQPRVPVRGDWVPGTPLPPGRWGVFGPQAPSDAAEFVPAPADPAAYGAALYRALRTLESTVDGIVIAPPPTGPGWALIHDRVHDICQGRTLK